MTSFVPGGQDNSRKKLHFLKVAFQWHFQERLCKFSHWSSHPWVYPALVIHFTFVSKTLTHVGVWSTSEQKSFFGRKWSCVYIDIFRAKLIEFYLQKCASLHCINFLNVFECFNMVSVCHPLHVKWFEREMKCFAKECKLYILAANMHERYDHNQGKLESNNNISSRYYITILLYYYITILLYDYITILLYYYITISL